MSLTRSRRPEFEFEFDLKFDLNLEYPKTWRLEGAKAVCTSLEMREVQTWKPSGRHIARQAEHQSQHQNHQAGKEQDRQAEHQARAAQSTVPTV